MELFKSDIFFVITSIAVVALTIVAIVALVYVIKILKDIRALSSRVRREGQNIIDDVEKVRTSIKKQSKRVANVISRKSPRKRTKSK